MAKLTTNQKVGGGLGVVSALALAVTTIGSWEGKKNDPYIDLAGIPTVCYGETRVSMRRYTDKECRDMLEKATEGFQKEVLRCTPTLRDKPYQLAAATSLAYNIGSKAYCGSTVARRFNSGDIKGGCESFWMWRVSNGRVVQGLVNRRADETKICLTNLR